MQFIKRIQTRWENQIRGAGRNEPGRKRGWDGSAEGNNDRDCDGSGDRKGNGTERGAATEAKATVRDETVSRSKDGNGDISGGGSGHESGSEVGGRGGEGRELGSWPHHDIRSSRKCPVTRSIISAD